MAILGREGIVEFKRELPSPIVIPASALDRANDQILVNSDSLWHCEAVVLIGNSAGAATAISGFLHKDTLDRVTLHTSIEGASNNDASTRIDLATLQQKAVILLAANDAAQTTSVLSFYTTTIIPSDSLVTSEVTLADWPEAHDAYLAAGSQFIDWKIQANLRSWTLNTNAAAVDTSVIGERFSEAVKGVISGSGTFDFVVDLFGSPDEFSPETLIRLVLINEYGGSADARFYLKKDKIMIDSPMKGRMNNRSPIRGSLCYKARILVVSSVIDMAADGIVQGSADFVTTGEIRLATEVTGVD